MSASPLAIYRGRCPTACKALADKTKECFEELRHQDRILKRRIVSRAPSFGAGVPPASNPRSLQDIANRTGVSKRALSHETLVLRLLHSLDASAIEETIHPTNSPSNIAAGVASATNAAGAPVVCDSEPEEGVRLNKTRSARTRPAPSTLPTEPPGEVRRQGEIGARRMRQVRG